MGTSKKVHQACRRFEFAINGAVPEQVRQLYQLDTYGLIRSSDSIADFNMDTIEGEVIAEIFHKDGKVFVRPPDTSE